MVVQPTANTITNITCEAYIPDWKIRTCFQILSFLQLTHTKLGPKPNFIENVPFTFSKRLGTGRKVQEGVGWINHDSVCDLDGPPSFGQHKNIAHPLYPSYTEMWWPPPPPPFHFHQNSKIEEGRKCSVRVTKEVTSQICGA